MMIMGTLEPRQKQEWKTAMDDHWIRTGCSDLWDAVFIAFREYRDAAPSTQTAMIKDRTKVDNCPTEGWVGALHQRFQEKHKDRGDGDENEKLFFQLLPLKLFTTEMVPYIQNYISHNAGLTMEQVHEEIIDKCKILAEYRQQKKKLEIPPEQLENVVCDYLRNNVLKGLEQISYDSIQEAMTNIEHQLIIISPQEKVLFDSKTWGEGIDGGEYQDVIIVLAHPDNTYDSIGRISYTKDNHQKISRLFHYDDDIIENLRKQ
jgi:hypothetical protein